ncbi:non-canonical poly(A) RNA polymerase PAPD5 [Cucurbita moschata]|uniref:polynucleotide adenylyltransferase n=1 Tax=Cucurbita moschata TaxID=3662 RepID=A0A6J1F9G2_CUCMO|nr:non-canonical poly(A) RNA polymerase PAPD5 [Cucurbita moschata]XP_022936828.1 non-canonical poly(A) RNA polymerase PAPD5 [Cucurbita moschata]
MEEETVPQYLYDTLSPLSFSAVATTGSEEQLSPSDNLEPYAVFRNEISLSTSHSAPAETAATEFFALDVAADNVEEISGFSTPLAVTSVQETEPRTPECEDQSMLESGWFRGNGGFKSPMLQLHKEIVDFCEFLSPTEEERVARDSAVERVFSVVKHIWPHCKVEVFGSFQTGLYLPTSDIDVVILDSGIPKPQLGLQALSRALSQKGIAKKIQVIGKARVPIIKFVEKQSGISFDMSFDVQNGPKAADFIKGAISKWPPLRPLCLILKVFLQQRELNEVYSGGLGSYALLTMLMAMLQSFNVSHSSLEHNLGVLLVHFFDFYGRKLNTSDVGVSCNTGGIFFSKSNRGFMTKGRPFLLSIEDPQAPDNDIGKNSYNYFQIRSAFAMAFSILTNVKTILGLGPNRSILGTIIRPDPVLLKRKGGRDGEVTFTSLLPGAGEPIQQQPEYGDGQEMLCNWQFGDDEPLPRGNDASGNLDTPSSKKKRKSREKSRNKEKENRGSSKRSKEKSSRKKRWRENGSDGRRSPWKR